MPETRYRDRTYVFDQPLDTRIGREGLIRRKIGYLQVLRNCVQQFESFGRFLLGQYVHLKIEVAEQVRLSGHPCLADQDEKRQKDRFERYHKCQECERAVSYTHLTLP